MPTREDDFAAQQAWVRFAETTRKGGFNGIIFDKTPRSSVGRELSHHSLDKWVTVVLAPFSEPYFTTLARLNIPEHNYIQQFHDDDHWRGLPSLAPGDGITTRPVKVILEPERRRRSQTLRTQEHLGLLLGAIPGMLWNRFCSLALDQKAHASGALDWTLAVGARVCGVSEPQLDFTYIYTDHHWSDRDEALRRLVSMAREAGWDDWACEDLYFLNTTLDSLTLLGLLADVAPLARIRHEATRLVQHLSPRHRRAIRYQLAITGRVAISPRGLESASGVVQQEVTDLLQLSMRVRSLQDLLENLLPRLAERSPVGVRSKVDLWRFGINRLKLSLTH